MVHPGKAGLLQELRDEGRYSDPVLEAFDKIPREAFTPEAFWDEAYENRPLPIEQGQTLSQPSIVAMMTEALELDKRKKVLEIGTGSGYQAAILSRLCRRVFTIERHRELLKLAQERFDRLRLHNITTLFGDGYKGWKEQAPFERILLTAAPPEVPEKLLEQLDMGGIMVLPLGERKDEQVLLKITRTPEGFAEEKLVAVRFVPMIKGIPAPK